MSASPVSGGPALADVLAGMQEVDHATFFARIGPMNVTPRPFCIDSRFMYSDFVDPYGRSHGRRLTDGNCIEPTRYALPLAREGATHEG